MFTCASIMPVRGQAPPDLLARIKGLKCAKQEGSVRVSYRMDGALGPEVRKNLERGIPVTFIHRLSVVRRRALFFDKQLARKTIEVTVSLDTLTQQYTLAKTIDGLPAETSTTDRAEEIGRWLTEVHDVVIPLPAEGDKGTIELRVKAEYETNYFVFWVIPWSLRVIDAKECR